MLLSCSNGNVDNPERGDIRLSSRPLSETWFGNGHVEMFLSETWITVAGDFWTIANSQVACRQLGYVAAGGELTSYNAHLGPSTVVHSLAESVVGNYGNSTQRIGNVSCTGSESRLIDCPHNIVHNNSEPSGVQLQCYHGKYNHLCPIVSTHIAYISESR